MRTPCAWSFPEQRSPQLVFKRYFRSSFSAFSGCGGAESMNDPAKPGFDAYAAEYDAALAEGLSVSGESKDFFAQGRVEHLAGLLQELQFRPGSIMDFGCGTGTNTPFLLKLNGVASLLGVDVSGSSLNIARRTIPDTRAAFSVLDQFQPDGRFDLVFTNGVFHHIPPAERANAIDY